MTEINVNLIDSSPEINVEITATGPQGPKGEPAIITAEIISEGLGYTPANREEVYETDRKLDALWKLNQGISYQFETDAERAYQKDIPSGAKLASVKKIGGRTIVWNQLVAKQAESEYNYGLDFAWLDNGKIKISGTSTYVGGDPNTYTILKSIEVIGSHKYLFKLTGTDRFCILGYGIGDSTVQSQKFIFNAPDSGTENLAIYGIEKKIQSGTVIDDIACPQIYDLTQMFGAGNEPSTPEEFEALFPEDYYPYNEGELISMPVNEVVEQGKNLIDIPDYKFERVKFCTGIHLKKGKYYFSADIESTSRDEVAALVFRKNEKEVLASSIRIKQNASQVIDLSDDIDEIILYAGASYIASQGYTATYKNIMIDSARNDTYSSYHKNTYSIPQSILELDGYGDGVSDDVYNYVDWENKEYHKRVGRVDLGSLTYTNNGTASDGSIQWKSKEKISKKEGSYVCVCPAFTERRASGTIVPITNGISDLRDDCSIALGYIGVTNAEDFAQAMSGVMLYYELAEEQIIDISDIIDATFQEPIEVEAGGILTFQNSNGDSYRLPVPNEEEYIVSLAEVGGGTSE